MSVPASRFSFFYALYFALLGCISPFWGLYLQSLEFSAADIGTLMAIFGVVRILAPNLWAAQAGRFRGPVEMIRIAGALTVLFFCLIFVARDFITVAIVMIAYGFFWAAMLPQYEVLCMQSLQNQLDLYSRVRLWGSLGFIMSVIVVGMLLDVATVSVLPVVMLVLMLLITANAWGIKESPRVEDGHEDGVPFLRLLASRAVIGFILVNILLQISFGPYYTFFSIFLEENGYSPALTGVIWSAGVIAEVLLFWQFGRIMHLLSWRNWIVLSMALTALRWSLTGVATASVTGLLILQTLHAFSFAVMHAVSMRYVQTLFPKGMHGRGQALYSSVGFGLGGAIGAWGSGLLWMSLGGTLVFTLAGIAALLAVPVALFTLNGRQTTERDVGR
jgi:PPP family 3-phenylpropionic acid transporter